MSRETILKEVSLERDMQIGMGHTQECDAVHSQSDWIALLTRHVGLAVDDGAEGWDRYRKQLIRVAAVAVAAVEDHDKKHGRTIDHSKLSGPGW